MKGVVVVGSARGKIQGGSARVTIPDEIVAHLDIKPKDYLKASVDDQGRIVFERLMR